MKVSASPLVAVDVQGSSRRQRRSRVGGDYRVTTSGFVTVAAAVLAGTSACGTNRQICAGDVCCRSPAACWIDGEYRRATYVGLPIHGNDKG
jgi:hypothetical protein